MCVSNYYSIYKGDHKQEYRKIIFEAIRNNQDASDLFNVQLPWHDSDGNVIATRFYHYFTYKELIEIMRYSQIAIVQRNISGGRHGDANFFLHLKKG